MPQLPADLASPEPRIIQVPRSAALTPIALQHKTTYWPTVYAPRKKHELEPWSRGRARWAWEAMSNVIREAQTAKAKGEVCEASRLLLLVHYLFSQLPIVAYVPVPYDESTRQQTQVTHAIQAHDTRTSLAHPLRHAVLNLVRRVADEREKSPSSSPQGVNEAQVPSSTSAEENTSAATNGSHYLLTSLTVFLSHEPCIMCSMALLHSRAKEIVYLYPMEKTGGCGGVACLPRLPGVNHRFGIGKWKSGCGLRDMHELDVDDRTDA